jgi:hypothetical protein
MATSSSNVPKKWGSASKFQGRRGEFLELWVPAYCEASRKKLTVKLWDRVFPQYWANFPWRSPLEEDVSGPLFVDTSENWESPVVEPENLTPEETQQKVTVVDATQKVSVFIFLQSSSGSGSDFFSPSKSRLGLITGGRQWVCRGIHGPPS